MSESKTSNAGIGLSGLVFLVFLTLKLAEIGSVATWSWWWITSPLWIPILIIIGICVLLLLCAGIKFIFS